MDTFFVLFSTIFFVLLYVSYRMQMQKQKYWEKHGVPTIISSVPYIGNIWPVVMARKSMTQIYCDIYNSIPNCSMIGMYNCGENELMLKDPELIKSVLQTNFSNFQKNGFFIDPESNPLLKLHPFINVGQKWKSERATLTNAVSKLKYMAPAICEIGIKMTKYLNDKIKENGGVFEFEAQPLFARFTSEVVARVGFGIDGQSFDKDTGTFADMGKIMFPSFSNLTVIKEFFALFIPSLTKIFQLRFISEEFDVRCRRIVKDILQMRKEKGLRGTDILQNICDLNISENGEINDDFVMSHIVSFFIDAYMTSSYVLSYIVYDIARHPEVQNKLRAEVRNTFNQHQGELTHDVIQNMKYLDLVIKESMRVSTVLIQLKKSCTEEIKLVGSDGVECVVKPGTNIIITPPDLHNDPKFWKNPEVFWPERFDDEHKNDFPKFAYLPFGGGPRICIGMRMALLQMKCALVFLINKYSLTVSSKTKLPFVFENDPMLNVPKGGIWLNIKPV